MKSLLTMNRDLGILVATTWVILLCGSFHGCLALAAQEDYSLWMPNSQITAMSFNEDAKIIMELSRTNYQLLDTVSISVVVKNVSKNGVYLPDTLDVGISTDFVVEGIHLYKRFEIGRYGDDLGELKLVLLGFQDSIRYNLRFAIDKLGMLPTRK